jgi:hypothetical protein
MSKLSNNTAALNALLEAVNSLPSAGSDVPEVELATPTISVAATGVITASITQEAGKVAGGTKTATLQQTVRAAQTITPGTADQSIAAYQYLTGKQTIKGDANLKPENIVSGVSIFNVAGTAQTGGGGGSEEVDSLIDGTITSVSSNATKVGDYRFRNCDSLVTVSLPNAKSIGSNSFYNCDALTTFEAPNVTTLGSNGFYQCMKLASVTMPKVTTIPSSCFGNCTGLTTADFTALTKIEGSAFGNTVKLVALILRGSSVVTLSSTNVFSMSGIATTGKGYIYVPAALLSSYQTASNWSTYAANFRAIEDYPDITGG